MDALELLSKYQAIFVWFMGIVIFVTLTLLATRFATKAAHDQLRKEHDDLSKVVNKLEFDFVVVKDSHIKLKEEFAAVSRIMTVLQTKVEALPTDETISELKEGMVRLEGSIEVVLEKFGSNENIIARLEKQVDRIDNFLVRSAT